MLSGVFASPYFCAARSSHTLAVALCVTLLACSPARKGGSWDNISYGGDNDASYVPPVSCMDDAPSC